MAVKELMMGVDSPSPAPKELKKRIMVLQKTIRKYVPEFAEAVASSVNKEADFVALHQDGFAANYDGDEYILLGMAIKYAGLYGVKIMVIGNEDA